MHNERNEPSGWGRVEQGPEMLDVIFAFELYCPLSFRGRINHFDIQRTMIEAGEDSVELLL